MALDRQCFRLRGKLAAASGSKSEIPMFKALPERLEHPSRHQQHRLLSKDLLKEL